MGSKIELFFRYLAYNNSLIRNILCIILETNEHLTVHIDLYRYPTFHKVCPLDLFNFVRNCKFTVKSSQNFFSTLFLEMRSFRTGESDAIMLLKFKNKSFRGNISENFMTKCQTPIFIVGVVLEILGFWYPSAKN